MKIEYYLKLCLENIFWQNYLFHLSKEVFLHNFRHILDTWIFEGNSTAADLTKIVKILYYLKLCLENIFWQNYLFHLSNEVFLHNFRHILENGIFEGNSTAADLTKIVKIEYYLKMCLKNIFGKIIISTYQRKCFSTILGIFWKIEFLKGNSTAADLTKIVKI